MLVNPAASRLQDILEVAEDRREEHDREDRVDPRDVFLASVMDRDVARLDALETTRSQQPPASRS